MSSRLWIYCETLLFIMLHVEMVDSATHRSYLQRMTPLFCLNELCETIGAKYVIEKVMSIVQLVSSSNLIALLADLVSLIRANITH